MYGQATHDRYMQTENSAMWPLANKTRNAVFKERDYSRR